MKCNYFIPIVVLLLSVNFHSYGQECPDHTLNKTIHQHRDIQPAKDGISFLAIDDFGRHGFFMQKEALPGFMTFTLTKNILKAYVIQSNKEDFKVVYQTEIKK